MRFLKNFSNTARDIAQPSPAAGPADSRLYAVGDIHGRRDLLEQLLDAIEADVSSRPPRKTYIVFLGDFIDRGPDSAGVIETLRTYSPSFAKPIFIAGNHEEVFFRILGGEQGVLRDWLNFGGAECAQSYGLDPKRLERLEPAAAIEQLRKAVPESHVEFFDGLADTFRFGSYLFVHAGIRPGVELFEQDQFDLRWIREPFLSHGQEHGMIVVHGHTIVSEVDERANRICIDTGAYRTGRLTALGIEGTDRWYLSATADSEAPAPTTTA